MTARTRKECAEVIYITGDTHRDFERVGELVFSVSSSTEDVMIILGDAGINYYGEPEDRELKEHLSVLPITLLCIHGNHEMRPENANKIICYRTRKRAYSVLEEVYQGVEALFI